MVPVYQFLGTIGDWLSLDFSPIKSFVPSPLYLLNTLRLTVDEWNGNGGGGLIDFDDVSAAVDVF